jgi:excinuclease ABC subunit A
MVAANRRTRHDRTIMQGSESPPPAAPSSVASPSPVASPKPIELRGVRVNNLKNVDLDLPMGKLVVLSGVSGSGKSSLAFDTIFAEGQRRYIESFSAAARQYLERIERPNADRIAHVPPPIAIRSEDGRSAFSARATVASLAQMDDELRRLFARVGRVICPECRSEVRSHSAGDIVQAVADLPSGTRVQLCFAGQDADDMAKDAASNQPEAWLARGFTRAIVGGRSEAVGELDATVDPNSVWLVADRMIAGQTDGERVAESAETALREGDGRCMLLVPLEAALPKFSPETVLEPPDTHTIDGRIWRVLRFSRHWECGTCRREFLPPAPRLFEAESGGGCTACRDERSTNIAPPCPVCRGTLLRPEALAVRIGADNIADVLSLTAGHFAVRLTEITSRLTDAERSLSRLVREELRRRVQILCDLGLDHLVLLRRANTLSGGQVRRVLLAAAIGSRVTGTLCVVDEPSAGLLPAEMPRVIRALRSLLDQRNSVIVVDHAPKMIRAADHVIDLGPGAGPLGGAIVFSGSPGDLAGVADSATARALREDSSDNSIPPNAGWTPNPSEPPLDPPDHSCNSIGPSFNATESPRNSSEDVSGRTGGANILRSGIPTAARRRPPRVASEWITLRNVRHRNLCDVTMQVPLGVLCVVTGPSGSGKTSLVVETLVPAVCERLGLPCDAKPHGRWNALTGGEAIVDVQVVDREPLTRSSRSNAATWIDVFDEIREVFAMSADAKQRGFGPQHFSFNAAQGGRCRACRGTGVLKHDMQFLPDITLACPECGGSRYRREILDVKYRGRSIADVLAMSAAEAATFFRNHPRLQSRLQMLKQIGLDYLVLGQPTDTLSGGEAQRMKLAAHFTASRGPTLIVCDEPTAGLHPADIVRLIGCFDELLGIGHSIVVIDNSPDLLRAADHVIELGTG